MKVDSKIIKFVKQRRIAENINSAINRISSHYYKEYLKNMEKYLPNRIEEKN